MSTTARKARKRAGIRYTKPQKRKQVHTPKGLGLVTGAEILAGIVIRGTA